MSEDPRSYARRSTATVAAFAALAASFATQAENVVGLTSTNALVSFDSSTPWQASNPLNITGLLGANERILGLDLRPSTGLLYGLGSAGNVYTLDAGTGAATFVAALTANPTDTSNPYSGLRGSAYGVDFNPVPDLGQALPSFRVTSNAGENLRINVNAAGAGSTFTDGALNIPAGGMPTIAASAYSNNDRDANTATMLYGIDVASDTLYVQAPPNDGTLVAVGHLGVDTTGVAGFDISGASGAAYAALNDGLTGKSALYSIDLANGMASKLGDFGIGGNTAIAAPLLGLTVAPIPEPGTYAMMLAGLLGVALVAHRRSAAVRPEG